VRSGQSLAARRVLLRLRPPDQVDRELEDIEASAHTRSGGWAELLSPTLRIALVVGIGLAIFQQVTGINTVIYYAPTVIQLAGIPSASGAILATTGIGVVNVVMTVVAMLLLDRVGRRPLLLGGIAVMAASLFVLGLAFVLTGVGSNLGVVSVVCLMVYVGAFAISLGPIFWLLIAEIAETSEDRLSCLPTTIAEVPFSPDFMAAACWLRTRIAGEQSPSAIARTTDKASWRDSGHSVVLA
jgi:MFS transporter, SP family, galactose:H+ symporter